MHLHDFNQEKKRFIAWLREHGVVEQPLTNEYEVLRFASVNGVAIIYRNKQNILTFTESALVAWEAFKTKNNTWLPVARLNRKQRSAKKRLLEIQVLMRRDGPYCIVCGQPLSEEAATIEHIVPISQGGPDTLANKALAHEKCNQLLGNDSAAQKILYILAIRKQEWALTKINQFDVKDTQSEPDPVYTDPLPL